MIKKINIKKLISIIVITIMLVINLNFNNEVLSATKSVLELNSFNSNKVYNPINNNREPRVSFKKTEKNNLYIILHDDAGLKTSKSYFNYNGKKYNLKLIENSNGVYNNEGKRIKDLKNSKNYSGKKYDYGIILKNSEVSTAFKSIYVHTYDHGNSCYLKETFKIKKTEQKDSQGYYYQTDCAPRVTVHLIDGKPKVDAIDWSGIKSIKIMAEKTNEVVYSYEVLKEGIEELPISGAPKEKSGYALKNGLYYPFKVVEELDMNLMEKAKAGEGRYRLRVIAEDKSGIKNEKTMTTHISAKNGSTSTNTNTNKNTNTNTNKNTNTNTSQPPKTGQGTTYYVSTKGSDSNSGKSVEKALKHVKTGIKKLSAGDTLVILAGTYNEKLEIKKDGSSGNPITIKSQGSVTISGKNKSGALLELDGAKYINVHGIRFADMKADESQGIYLIHGSSHITISNCKFENIKCKNKKDDDKGTQAIYAVGKKGKAINDLNIINCTLKNIGSGTSENISIEGNCTNVTIKNTTVTSDSSFKGNIGICLCVGSGGTRPNNVTVSGCNVSHCKSPYDDAAYGIYVDGGENIKFINNKVSNSQGGIEIGAEKGNSSHSGKETENVTVSGNTISNCNFGVQIGGYNGKGRTYNVKFENNSVLNCGGKNSEVLTLSRSKKTTISNSKFVSSNKAMIIYNEMSSDKTKEVTFKSNTYSNGGSKSSKYFEWHGKEYNFSKWKSKTGDSGSVFK